MSLGSLEEIGESLSKNIYIAIPLLFLVSTSQANIHATTVENCVTWLKRLEAPPAAPQAVHPSATKEYLKYKRARAADPNMKPLTLTFDSEPPESELRESIYLWWYPGNIFNALMIPKNKEFADHILRGGEVPPDLVPTDAERMEEARNRAEQPLIAEPRKNRDEVELARTGRGRIPLRFDEMYDERLETSPTKYDGPLGLAHADMGAPAAGDPASGHVSDAGPPPSDSH